MKLFEVTNLTATQALILQMAAKNNALIERGVTVVHFTLPPVLERFDPTVEPHDKPEPLPPTGELHRAPVEFEDERTRELLTLYKVTYQEVELYVSSDGCRVFEPKGPTQ